MKLTVVDYSQEHFHSPPRQRKGKFIQVLSEDAEYIIMAPKEMSTFHANIAEKFFSAHGIRGRYNHKRDNYKITHNGWAILGGGHWELDEDSGVFTLYGMSMAYGRFNSAGLTERMEKAMPGHRVIVKS